MVTPAVRRLATAVLAGAVLLPTGLLVAVPASADEATPTAEITEVVEIGEAVYEEAQPDPVTGLYPGQYVPATESSPATPGWITGGTLQEANEAAPAAPPAPVTVRPAAPRPQVVSTVTQPAPVRAARRPARTAATTPAPVGEATVLPFTGPGRLEVQLGVGAGLVVLGAFAMVAARPRPTV